MKKVEFIALDKKGVTLTIYSKNRIDHELNIKNSVSVIQVWLTKWCGEKQINWFKSMNVWNVFQTHWRDWSCLEIGCFGIILRER